MANRSEAERNTLITTAAGIFAKYTRDAKEIAAILDTSERNIHRWGKTPQWAKALVDIGYEGDRSFRVETTRDIQRDYADILDDARDLYLAAVDQGHSYWKATGIVEEKLGVNRRTVEKWALRFGWRVDT